MISTAAQWMPGAAGSLELGEAGGDAHAGTVGVGQVGDQEGNLVGFGGDDEQ
ncbi:hypothetical protein UAJ10_02255 [Nitrospirillum sp. BR 11164]|uniref:hypothetical protein n=1 Tax=Nitrospirillum sp. BR 11164 TaxID=3104324 RepID=UPI002AFF7C52|nr:hypothetical protein [Nitrospirillum sp. BR 11164]MEA1647841.1 hypothetical protein [Nitrospirillum sp. BR 11164]